MSRQEAILHLQMLKLAINIAEIDSETTSEMLEAIDVGIDNIKSMINISIMINNIKEVRD